MTLLHGKTHAAAAAKAARKAAKTAASAAAAHARQAGKAAASCAASHVRRLRDLGFAGAGF
jgi:hypothetical protein